MHKLNVVVVAALLAGAAVLGTLAAVRTTSLGAAHRSSADAAVVARAKQLDRFERALQAQAVRKPPALPRVPAVRQAVPAQAPTPRVVYRRPPAIVVVKHSSHREDDGYEASEREGGDD